VRPGEPRPDGWEERDPISFLRERVERFRPVRLPGLPPLVAGAIGYFSYDMVRLIERIPKRLRDEIGLYDAMLMFYHGLVAFDHVQHRLWIVRNVSPKATAVSARNTTPPCAKSKRRAGCS